MAHRRGRWTAALVTWLSWAAALASAQSLNWEGQTGAFITPFAYTASSGKWIGLPAVSYHYLDAGPVIGGYFQASATVGVLKRAEFGYTHAFHRAGETAGLSQLWTGGFNTVHGKVNFARENAAGRNWFPALAAGFVARTQVRNVGGVVRNRDTRNGDVYVVATKTVTQVPRIPVLLNLGYKATNASVFGLAGNATAVRGRLFGAGAFVLPGVGPAHSSLIFGSEFVQQPRRLQDLSGPIIPTTITYFLRIVPKTERVKMNIDFGVAQVAGRVLPGVNLASRHQFATGYSLQF